MFFASGLLALLPSIAHSVNKSPIGYGILLGCFGFGAVVGAMAMQQARARWSAEAVVSSGILIFGLATVASGLVHFLPALAIERPDRGRGMDRVRVAVQCGCLDPHS